MACGASDGFGITIVISSTMRYPKGHKERTRRAIVEAASRVFRRRGYAEAGVDGLAAEAGVTSGAFYGHFRSKEELLTEVVRTSVARAEATREAGLEGLEGAAWVTGLLRRYLSPEHWRAVEEGCPIPTLVSELSRAGQGPREAFAEAVEALVERMTERLGEGPAVRETVLAGLALAVGGMALARAVGDEDLGEEVLGACRGRGVEAIVPTEGSE